MLSSLSPKNTVRLDEGSVQHYGFNVDYTVFQQFLEHALHEDGRIGVKSKFSNNNIREPCLLILINMTRRTLLIKINYLIRPRAHYQLRLLWQWPTWFLIAKWCLFSKYLPFSRSASRRIRHKPILQLQWDIGLMTIQITKSLNEIFRKPLPIGKNFCR